MKRDIIIVGLTVVAAVSITLCAVFTYSFFQLRKVVNIHDTALVQTINRLNQLEAGLGVLGKQAPATTEQKK